MRGPTGPEKGLLHLVVERPVAVTMLVLAVAVFGLVSLADLPVDLLPDVSYPTLTVRTEYPGAAPGDVEKLVTKKIEQELSVVSDLVDYRSISRAGVSDVILEFEWDTPMTFAAQDVREKVDQVLPRLPEGVERPLLLRYDPTLEPILRIALFPEEGRPLDLEELRILAEEEVRQSLESGLPGVAAVRVRGGFEEEWRIELDEGRLAKAKLSTQRVAEVVGLENANVAGGILRDGDREALVRTLGEIKTPRELERMVIDTSTGEPVRIEQIGEVVVGTKERDVVTRIDGVESVEIEVFKEAGANTVEVARAVKGRLFGPGFEEHLRSGVYVAPKEEPEPEDEAEEARGPPGEEGPRALFDARGASVAAALGERGVGVRILSDQSVFIEQSLAEVRSAALYGALLAILVLYLFLRRVGPTLIIGITIPVSVIATFAPLRLSGVSLNVMSLGGLALGVGMLVDSAIVVLEAISRRREGGAAAKIAAVEGTREVGLAVLASTLTTVAVFLPIVFVQGIAGEFFRDQALAVVFSLVAALLAALFFIPMLASREWRRTESASSDLPGGLSRALVGPRRWFAAEGIRDALRSLRDGGLVATLLAPFRLLLEALIRLPLEALARLAAALCALLIGGLLGGGRLLARGLGFLMRVPLALFDRAWLGVERIYGRLLRMALGARFLTLVAAGLLTAFAVSRAGALGVELVPKVHQGEFTVEMQLDVTTPVEETDRVARRVTEVARRTFAEEGLPVLGLASSAGVPRDVIAKSGEGQHTVKVHVRLDREGDLEALERRAIRSLRAALREIPGLADPVVTRPALFTTRTALEVEVVGASLERLREVASALESRMRALDGLTDVTSTDRTGYPELVVIPDRERLARLGLGAGEIAQLMSDKVLGRVGTRVSKGDRKIDVLVRARRDLVESKAALLDLRVNPGQADAIPLRAVARVEERPGPAEIRRVGGERTVVLGAEVQDLDLEGAARRIEAAAEDLRVERPELFEGVIVRVAGQREESRRSLRSLGFALLVATFLVYVVMASQFESLIHPFVILFTVPLALVGAVLALDLLEIELSIVVLLGGILLVGIVVNNAIVLVDRVNRNRREGLDRTAALLDAGRVRLRPIVMTTATTVLGLFPLALGLGEGSEIRTPMAITVIAGLVSSTALTLLVIPVVYALVTRDGPLDDAPGAER